MGDYYYSLTEVYKIEKDFRFCQYEYSWLIINIIIIITHELIST